jgi:hypothetical protein
VAAAHDELVTATCQAIADATDFDERDMNHNFDYEAYKADLPANEAIGWCSAMLANDRVGCIAREPLESLRNHFQAATNK